ncbi:MAG: hypothetical protein LBB24_01930 [Rickettsiales bacterium]|nr:hypothetical protein [Rickettsiales bacterium]
MTSPPNIPLIGVDGWVGVGAGCRPVILWRNMARNLFVGLLLLVLIPTSGFGSSGGPIALFGDWSLFRSINERRQEAICFVMAIPNRRYDNLSKRGESFFIVMKNKRDSTTEILLSHGHVTTDKIVRAEINIAKRKFPIFVHDDRAWTFSYFDDRSIVDQLGKAVLFSVEIEYENGKNLIDIYQLNGFSESYNRLLTKCD